MPSVEKVEFVRLDPSKFPKHDAIEGKSPFAEKYQEGPSYTSPESRAAPLKVSGALDAKYGEFRSDSTPLLGTEYSSKVRLTDIISNPELLRDLAITISERGVVFFRNQDDLTVEQQKRLVDGLGIQSGKPKTSGLHIHPLAPGGGIIHDGSNKEEGAETGSTADQERLVDPEVSFISSRLEKGYYGSDRDSINQSRRAAEGWHSDITFEPVPADYSSLKIVEIPENGSGGDTLWANGYALLEKFSPSFREYLETLTGTYAQPRFSDYGDKVKFKLYSQPRGAPENVGLELSATHPIVRTNPVTGWKSLFALGAHFTSINEVSTIESALIKKFILDTLVSSHDIQVRFSWNKNDIAIWDNRSTYHSATYDYLAFANREGIRTVGIAERPYLDPKSGYQSDSALEKFKDLKV